MAELEKPLPVNLEAERSVLGSILLDNAALAPAREFLVADDFFLQQHRHVFYQMVELHDAGKAIDLITLTEELSSQGELEVAGGAPYLAALADGMPKVSNVEHYARIVKEKAMLRSVIHATHHIQQKAFEGEAEASEILDNARTALSEILHQQPRGGLEPIKEIVKNGFERLEKIFSEGRAITGVPSGYSELDKLTSGLQASELLILAARPSQGKAQPLNTLILTPHGFVALGQLRLGDEVIGSNGLPCKVIGVFAQGLKQVYRVVFSDSTETECCDEHLWWTVTRNERRNKGSAGSVKRLKEIQASLLRADSGGPNHAIPLVRPVRFSQSKVLSLPPRLLGLLLGDGDFTQACIRFHKPEQDLLDEIASLLPKEDSVSPIRGGVSIRRAHRNNAKSATRLAIEALGLSGRESTEKFIPKEYLYADPLERLELLSGLFDTDGSVANGFTVEYSTSSSQLAKDVAFLARSLGAIVAVSDRIPEYEYRGQKLKGALSFRLCVHFPCGTIPVRSKKNLSRWRKPSRFEHRSIVDVVEIIKKQCACISVDSADGLYVTDDFILTHNTALALNITENACIRAGKAVAFFSLEMSKDSLLQRLIAAVGQIDAHKFRTGHLSKADWTRMTEVLGQISMAPLWIDDGSSSTVGEITARSERLKHEAKLDLVVVDYLQLIGTSQTRGRSRQEEVSAISRGLKALAKDLAVPVLALSQLTRAPEKDDRAPLLSDLRESGAIEQDADVVLFIHRPNLYKRDATPEERDEANVIVAKQRNGPTDTVKFIFRSRYTRFEEAVPDSFNFGDPQ